MASLSHRLALTAGTIAVVLLSGTPILAQMVPCTGGVMGGGMLGFGCKKNAPFAATQKSTFEQKLADGNAIHGVTTTHQARDSAGRTRTEMAQGCTYGEDGKQHEQYHVNVFDPIARISMNWAVGWDNQPNVVQLIHHPDHPLATSTPQPPSPPDAEELARREKAKQVSRVLMLQQQKENHHEDLGTKQINGVTAQGTRTTRTIPPGEEGNDQPLVVTNEVWRSKEYDLTLMSINDDPRRGRTTTEYEEFSLGEPDPSLFAPPSGYKVDERTINGMGQLVGN